MWSDPNLEFRNRVGFDEAIQSEPMDGLILMDIRTIKKPPFFEKLAEDGWGFSFNNGYYAFYLKNLGRIEDVEINISVFSNHEGARQEFLNSAIASLSPFPWKRCSKNFGTICAANNLEPKRYIFFIYRNIYIKIRTRSDNATIVEQTAEWLYDVLKNFPRSPMNAPFKLRDSIDNDPKALYEKAIQSEPLKSEPIDGLILTDIRMIRRPTFVDKWAENGWNYFAGKDHYSFGWKAVGKGGDINIGLEVFNSYEAARKAFFNKAVETFAPYPFEKCDDLGTLCALIWTNDSIGHFFVYRNLLLSTSSTTYGSATVKIYTRWLFKVLEDFPRSPMNAPFVLRGPKQKTP